MWEDVSSCSYNTMSSFEVSEASITTIPMNDITTECNTPSSSHHNIDYYQFNPARTMTPISDNLSQRKLHNYVDYSNQQHTNYTPIYDINLIQQSSPSSSTMPMSNMSATLNWQSDKNGYILSDVSSGKPFDLPKSQYSMNPSPVQPTSLQMLTRLSQNFNPMPDAQMFYDAKGKRLYACPFRDCNKLYYKTLNLRVHIREHTGERPYKCAYCAKKFIWNKIHLQLKRHIRTLTGEKRFVCNKCDKAFIRSDHCTMSREDA